MRFPPKIVNKCFIVSMAILLLNSCSKDSDLLADYVLMDGKSTFALNRYIVDDRFYIAPNQSVVLDVLSNDAFENQNNVKIIETSNPSNGTVEILENKTISYTPGPSDSTNNSNEETIVTTEDTSSSTTEPTSEVIEETTSATQESTSTTEAIDTFTYTTEFIDENETVSTEVGTVTVNITEYGEVRAFPTAEGHGKNATGGRGGGVLFVTNLNNSGQGSLRAALEASGSRYIVVRVAGYIDLATNINITNPNYTFEGNTAPGDGIIIRGKGITITDKGDNGIIRNLTMMLGQNGIFNEDDTFAMTGSDADKVDNVILDHCSFSHGRDENVGINSVSNITIQNSIISNDEGNGGLLIGNWDKTQSNMSVLNNIFVWNEYRNPLIGQYAELEYINNYHYGFIEVCDLFYGADIDFVGNVWENEVDSRMGDGDIRALSRDQSPSATKAYFLDNKYEGGNITVDATIPAQSSRTQASDYIPLASSLVKANVLETAGARRATTLGLNDYDLSLISDINGGVSNKFDSTPYNYPTLQGGSAYTDSDSDGMADSWEISAFGNLEQSSATDFDGDGYTDLEEFFFFLNNE